MLASCCCKVLPKMIRNVKTTMAKIENMQMELLKLFYTRKLIVITNIPFSIH